MSSRYAEVHARSLSDPESFWAEAAEAVHWTKRWERMLDDSNPPSYRWFTGGELNTCYNALDLHVENGRGDQAALIYDSPVTDTRRRYTYAGLRDEVARFAGVLAGLGVGRGDRVIVYMPMVPEAIIAMLACARLGAVHSVVFGGFASNELAVRIDDATPVAIVSASCGVEPGRVVEYKPLLDGERSVGKRGREAPAETPFVAAIETNEEGHHSEACPCDASDSTDAGTATQVALGSSGDQETFCAELHAHARIGGHPADAHRSRAGAGDADSETRWPTALRA